MKKIDNHQNTHHIPTSAFPPVNNLPLELKDPIRITTSKNWVLPPRPKPGRKPLSEEHDHGNSCTNTNFLRPAHSERKTTKQTLSMNRTNSISKSSVANINSSIASSPNIQSPISPSIPTPSPTPDMLSPETEAVANLSKSHPNCSATLKRDKKSPNKRSSCNNKKKTNNVSFNNKMIEIDCSVVHNPSKREILKINEENYYLKLEVIRLVSTLKNLREEVQPILEKRKQKPIIPQSMGKKSVSKKPTTLSSNAAGTKQIKGQDEVMKPSSIKEEKKPNSSLNTSLETTLVMDPDKQVSSKANPSCKQLCPKKRSHDEDINDLIVSLIDLNHSQTISDNSTTNNAITTDSTATNQTKPIPTSLDDKTNEMNFSTAARDPAKTSVSEEQNLGKATRTSSLLEKQVKMKSPSSYDEFMTVPQQSMSDFENPFSYEEDDFDLLSTVSTTPSTLFSLSLCATNDTIDYFHNNHGHLSSVNCVESIDELPPFDLLSLPNEDNLFSGSLDVHINYDQQLQSKSQNKKLNTFDTINSNFAEYEGKEVGSLDLMSPDTTLSNAHNSGDIFNDRNDDEMMDFMYMDPIIDVETDFENFVNGRASVL